MDEDKQMMVNPSASDISTFFDAGRLAEMGKMAEAFAKSGAFGSDVKNGYTALVKLQAGFEMGMAPMESMNSLYIVNGHVTIWGVAMIKRLRKFGWDVSYEDSPGQCTVTVKKGNSIHTYTATADEVKKGKAYAFAPKEKLRFHAISRIIRFELPEVLDAGITYFKEEAEDFEPAGIKVLDSSGIGMKTESVEEIITAISGSTTLEEMQAIVSRVDKLSGHDQEKLKEAIIAKRETLMKTKVGVDMAERGAERTIKTTLDAATGEVLDGEIINTPEVKEIEVAKDYSDNAVPEKPIRIHRAVKNDYWNFDKITTTLSKLKTNEEVIAFKDEMVTLYLDSEITEAVYKHAITETQRRLNQITKIAREENGQESLIPTN